jgi:hypothetical protein
MVIKLKQIYQGHKFDIINERPNGKNLDKLKYEFINETGRL